MLLKLVCLKRSNRTFMELKFLSESVQSSEKTCSNRTFMELKSRREKGVMAIYQF